VEVITDPFGWWVEPFLLNPWMRNALWVSLLTAIATSSVGTWVVLRGMSFLGDALAHGVLPGVAIAFIIGVDPAIGAFVAALAMVGGINLIRSRSRLPEDTAIGVFFVGFLALAVVIMSSRSGSYVGDLNRFLFGSIAGVSDGDVARQAVAAGVAVVGVLIFYRPFLMLAFDETQARLLGMRPQLAHAVLLGLLALAIVVSFETVGNLLVFAFLVAPPATASLLVRRVPMIMVTGVLIGAVSVVMGLLVSYHYGTAPGASMALAVVVVFLVVLGLTSIRRTATMGRVESA